MDRQEERRRAFERTLPAIVDAARVLEPERVILFGSRARGDFHSHSDVDIVILARTQAPFLDRALPVLQRLRIPYAVDILVYTPEELEQMRAAGNPLVCAALEEGRVIYDQRQPR